MKRLIVFSLLLFSILSKSQVIISDTTGDINCYHNGFIYTQINFLGSNVLSQWHFYDSVNSWIPIDTLHPSVFLNNNQYDSDTLLSDLCGLFRLKVVDNTGVLLQEKYYNIGCELLIFIEPEIIVCNDDLGVLSASVSGGIPFDNDTGLIGDEYYDYQWFSASSASGLNAVLLSDTSFFIDSLISQYYQLIVTDSIGCIDSTTFMYLLNPDPLEINFLEILNVSCNGDSTGSIAFSVSGGRKNDSLNPYYYFLISDLDTVGYRNFAGNHSANFQNNTFNQLAISSYPDSASFLNLTSDTFRLIVMDSSNCLVDTVFYLSEPEEYTLFASNNQLICSSDSVWIRIDSVTGGISPFSYYWQSVQIDSVFGSSSFYNCIIEDTINNCHDTIAYFVNSLHDINTEVSIYDVKCFSDSSGSISLDSIYGGSPPYSISINWPNNLLSSLPANDYILQIVDAVGCKYQDTLTVSEPLQISSNPIIYHPICHSDSNGFVIQNYQGGIPPYQLFGFNTVVNDTILNLKEGDYPYLIIDSNFCDFYDTLVIVDPLPISSDFINYSQHLDCFNGLTDIEIIVWDFDSSYTLLWSNGDTSATSSISAGISIVSIVDNNGCTHLDTVVITQPDTFKIEDLNLIDTICNVGGSAYVELSGGTMPYSYLWNSGDTNSSIINIQDSVIWIEVIDFCGNFLVSDSLSFIPYKLETSILFNESSHIAEVEIDFSTTSGPFSYEWKNSLAEVISLVSNTGSLCEGIYFVSITDISNGCLVEDTLIASFDLPFGIIDSTTTTVFPDSLLWGFPPYSYFWDNGSNLAHANLCPGEHWVEVTDNKGCIKRQDIDIDQLLISINPKSVLIECDLANMNIDIEAVATGGIPPYSFEWWNGSKDNPINLFMNPGNFSVKVTDANGCIEDTSFAIATMTSECIPDVFTPNGDAQNDTWRLEDTFLYEDSEVRIYSRFGKLIFQSVGYHEPWDGTNEQGHDLSEGVYFYSIKIGHGFDQIVGTVIILR